MILVITDPPNSVALLTRIKLNLIFFYEASNLESRRGRRRRRRFLVLWACLRTLHNRQLRRIKTPSLLSEKTTLSAFLNYIATEERNYIEGCGR
ncbi:hypothetical protein C0J52_10053 [Blattella germanica]|nr:hypothetical protein C0J52_10053 [Blattella germanica]